MSERVIVCPRCEVDIAVISDAVRFNVRRDESGEAVEMRVIEGGRIRHRCPLWGDPPDGDRQTPTRDGAEAV